MRKIILSVVFAIFSLGATYAQPSYYTVIQGGGTLGASNPGYEGAFSGYSLHFIFGRNFNERGFLGLGLGTEALKGDYRAETDRAEQSHRYDRSLFPVFADLRLPLKDIAAYSRVGLLANVGYAPKIGPVYDRGALAKAGFFYLYDSYKRTNLTVSATYGWQQLRGNFYGSNFNHQQINLSIGLMLT
ncbi:MAG: hypothetical protein ACTHWQ_10435 [Sphingobacterium sp.]